MSEERSNPLTARLLDEDKANEDKANEDVTEATPVDSLSPPAAIEAMRGEKQPLNWNRDWPFGVVFYIQFITIITVGGIYTDDFIKMAQRGNQPENESNDLNLMIVLLPILTAAGFAMILTQLALVVLTKMGKSFIHCSIWTNAIVSFVVGITALANGVTVLGVLFLFSALMGCCYACAVRNRIPFAAANLSAGVSSIKSNCGITLVSILFGVVLFAWIILWSISLVGVMDMKEVCDENGGGDESDCILQVQNSGWSVLWLLLLFWTQQVFKNVVHTTVAGVVGTWYFDPEGATSCCSSAIFSSLYRSLTYSFGSICFGSLLVAIIQTLDAIVRSLRNERQNGEQNVGAALLLCCLDCLLSLLQGIIEYFNKWAFIYVGVYGYPFLTAGEKVMTLFQERGWTVVINDNLVRNALSLLSLVIALLSGVTSLLVSPNNEPITFVAGFLVGLLLSSTVMSIIDSAVSTIIVCFAEAPAELEQNHSKHSRNMKEAWNKVYDISF
eukprot:CAMPEP_0203633670 /NCGR_PEP_ID=MMETSP0088-20131115/764_1 /ASSEMBLY_ACC=CAM_ASM_001087 /TAXON_ID=426623 /ORGANISM="Chaetoceros affinis, Strain CCMP159" /LENGTH=499 /DNA_ID=CAMNT_0050487063 /DNA_START=19 /DNA_END=1518 /DNA_ORIENTATION=-